METMTQRVIAPLLCIAVLLLILTQFVQQSALVVWLLAVGIVVGALAISFRQQPLRNILFAVGIFAVALLIGYFIVGESVIP